MKILCAPDSFKETMTAGAAAAAMAEGARRVMSLIEIDQCPVADGGEGTLDTIVDAMHGRIHRGGAVGPFGEPMDARFGTIGTGTAVIELAETAGLALVPLSRRDPTRTTTYGTGLLVMAAMQAGCSEAVLCIGGSATCDAATGLAQALGARFFDSDDQLIPSPMTGSRLHEVARVEPPPSLPRIRVACDVTNPLLGPNGAAAVYGPQKGATPAQVQELDAALGHLADVLGGDPNLPGAGAAGGAGYGLLMLCGASLHRGIDLVLDTVRFHERCQEVALVLTGEGRLDGQSLHGKTCMGVAAAARALGVPVMAIVGSTGPGVERCIDPSAGGMLDDYISLEERYGLARAMSEPAALIADATAELLRGHLVE